MLPVESLSRRADAEDSDSCARFAPETHRVWRRCPRWVIEALASLPDGLTLAEQRTAGRAHHERTVWGEGDGIRAGADVSGP